MYTDAKIIETKLKKPPEIFVAEIDEKSCALKAREKFLICQKKLEQQQKENQK